MTPEDVQKLVEMRKAGSTWNQLGEAFGITFLKARRIYLKATDPDWGKKEEERKKKRGGNKKGPKVSSMLAAMRYVARTGDKARPSDSEEVKMYREMRRKNREGFIAKQAILERSHSMLLAKVAPEKVEGATVSEESDPGTERCLAIVEDWLKKRAS